MKFNKEKMHVYVLIMMGLTPIVLRLRTFALLFGVLYSFVVLLFAVCVLQTDKDNPLFVMKEFWILSP